MDIHQWVRTTKAVDIMVRDILTVWPTHTLAQVAAMFLRESISAAPVVTQDARCVGVFTVSDIVRAEEIVAGHQAEVANSAFFTSDLTLPVSAYAQRLEELRDQVAPPAEHLVSEFMTTDLVSVHEETPLDEIVASMVDAHIHRILVMSQKRQLRGLITTIDVLAALRRASR